MTTSTSLHHVSHSTSFVYGVSLKKLLQYLKALITSITYFRYTAGENQYSFTYDQFDTSPAEPPVYVEKMETVKIYATTWNIITRIDLSLYDNKYQQLRNVVHNMSEVCTVMSNVETYNLYALVTSCRQSVQLLENIVNDTENTWKTHMVPAMEELRHKNFNFQPFLSTFDEINKNSSATKNFTTFIDGKEGLFTSYQMTDEMGVIDRKINAVKQLCNRKLSQIDMKHSIVKQFLQDLLSYTATTFTNYKVNQKIVYDILLSGKVLSLTTLQRELRELKDVLNAKKLDLPFNTNDELSTTFYKYVNIQSTLMNRQLFFVYILPIVEPTQFESYKLQPYPRKIEGSMFQLVIPEIRRIALNKQDKKYFNMDYIDLENCYKGENYILLCELNQPIISTENSGSCVVELLTDREVTHCDFRVMNFDHEIWFELQEGNSWLFVFPDASQVSIYCNGLVDQRFVTGVGILSILSTCHIKTEYVEFLAYEKDVRMKEKVNLAAESTIDWKDIIREINIMKRNITRYSVPKFINKDSVKLLEIFSTNIYEIAVDTKDYEKFATTNKSDSEKKTDTTEPLKANILNNKYNFELHIISAIISIVMSVIALIIGKLLSHFCFKKKSLVRPVKYVASRRDYDDED